jgi:hypothetical protein
MDAASVESLLRFAEEIRPRLRASGESSALEELESRYGQLRELLDWLLEQDRTDDAYRLASILVPFWIGTSRIDEGHAWFIPALQGAGVSAASRARALYDHGYLVFWAGITTWPASGSRSRVRSPSRSATMTLKLLPWPALPASR